jgi:hypothetical protein
MPGENDILSRKGGDKGHFRIEEERLRDEFKT